MNLIDTHCHLNLLSDDLDAVVQRARDAGVTRMITISTKLSQISNILKIAESYAGVNCSVGVHPHEAGVEGHITVEDLLRHTKHPKVVGIGETGLDYFYDKPNPEVQMDNFLVHIEAARMSKLPLIVHTRDADMDTAMTLENESKKGFFSGVLHCFTGGLELAERAIELGFYISISGIITFKKSKTLVEVLKKIPLDRILVETDSPYLAPMPFRGKTNEPAYVVETHRIVAEIMQIDIKEFAQITTKNSLKLFTKLVNPGITNKKPNK
jgi:TatD DNase family protein